MIDLALNHNARHCTTGTGGGGEKGVCGPAAQEDIRLSPHLAHHHGRVARQGTGLLSVH